MKKIRVYLQRPWKFSDSPYYQYLREDPPKNVEYINANDFRLIQSKIKFKINNFIKQKIKRTLRLFPGLPNAHLTKIKERYDLIHCAHCISLNNRPWICDIEYAEQFFASSRIRNKKPVLKILKNKNCKKILAWTIWSYNNILKEFPELKNKVEIVYPGISEQKFKKQKTKNINLLFSARRFYFKGGLHALEIIDRLTKKYDNVYGLIVSDVPEEIIKKYSTNYKINFLGFISKEKLFKEVYPISDIFVYPSYTDTFGFQITEALSFGIPVVCVGGHSRKEIIENGKTGYVINERKNLNIYSLENLEDYKDIIKEMEKKVELLIKNKRLRENISKNAIEEITHGKFSIKERNKKLERIYQEALR